VRLPVLPKGLQSYHVHTFTRCDLSAYGSDIIIPLDQLHPYHIERTELEHCVMRSHRWEARSLREHLRDVKQQAMYAVIHGHIDK